MIPRRPAVFAFRVDVFMRARICSREIIADEMYYFTISRSLNGDLTRIKARAINIIIIIMRQIPRV